MRASFAASLLELEIVLLFDVWAISTSWLRRVDCLVFGMGTVDLVCAGSESLGLVLRRFAYRVIAVLLFLATQRCRSLVL